ncbi:MAG: hypothetical protein WBD31_10405 [Rubripirellula sp.]
MAFLHGLANGEHSQLAEELSNRISAARLRLLNERKKEAYDQELRANAISESLQNDPAINPSTTLGIAPVGTTPTGFAPMGPAFSEVAAGVDSGQTIQPVGYPPQPVDQSVLHPGPFDDNYAATSDSFQGEHTEPAAVKIRKSARVKNSRDQKLRSKARLFTVLPGAVLLLLLCVLIALGKIRLDRDKMEAIGIPTDIAKSVAGEESHSPAVDMPNRASQSPTPSVSTRKQAAPTGSRTGSRSSAPTESRPNTTSGRSNSSVTSPPSNPNSYSSVPTGQPTNLADSGKVESTSRERETGSFAKLLEQSSKPLVPSESEIDARMKIVRDLYQEKYQDAKTKDQKTGLANELLRLAESTEDDPAGKFALMRVARDIFMGLDEYELAMNTVDQIAERFREVDEVKLKSAPLAALTSVGVGKSLHYADAVLSIANESIEQGKFQLGQALVEQARGKLPGGIPSSRAKEFEDLSLDFENASELFKKYQADASLLEANPGNKSASTTAGRYLCLIEDNWIDGLTYLANGSDEKLSKAARLENSLTAESGMEPEIGEAWYQAATGEFGPLEKRRLYDRSLHWFQLGLDGSKGLVKQQVEKRLEEIAPLTSASKFAANGEKELSRPDDAKAGKEKVVKLLDQKTYDSRLSARDYARILPGPSIQVGMGRGSGIGEASVGLEIEHATKIGVNARLSSYTNTSDTSAAQRIGFFIDYHTEDGYSKRVFLHVAGRAQATSKTGFTQKPSWGSGANPDEVVSIGSRTRYDIDLRRWAPQNWDERCWFSIYMKDGGDGCTIQAVVVGSR